MKKVLAIAAAAVAALVLLILFLPAVVWLWVGRVALVLLGLLLLLLFAPAVFFIKLQNGVFTVKVQVLFLRLQLLPVKKRTKKAVPKREEAVAAEEKPPEEEKKPQRHLEDLMDLVRRIGAAAKAGLKLLPKAFRIRGIDLVLPVQAQDAADLADAYGKWQAGIGAARAVLENTLNVRYKRLVLIPDFAGLQEDALFFSCKIYVFPVIMVAAGISALWKFLTWKKVRHSARAYRQAAARRKKNAA